MYKMGVAVEIIVVKQNKIGIFIFIIFCYHQFFLNYREKNHSSICKNIINYEKKIFCSLFSKVH